MVLQICNKVREIIFFTSIALIISNLGFAQEISDDFVSLNDTNISVIEKDKLFDSLLINHKNKDKTGLLLGDRYEIIKWQFQQGNLEKAIRLNKENLFLMDSLKFDNPTFYRRNTYSLGYYLMATGNKLEASKHFNYLIDSGVVDTYTYDAYIVKAQMAYDAEDYYLAAEQFEKAIAFSKTQNNTVQVLTNILRVGYAYKAIKSEKSINRGIALVNEGLDLLHKNKGKLDYFNEYLYTFYELLGDFYNDREDYNFEISFKNYSKAMEIAKLINDSLRLADVHNNIGYLHLQDSRKESIEYFNKALSFKPDVSMSSILFRNKSEYYLKHRDKPKALEYIQKSIFTLTKIDTSRVESLPKSDSLKQQNYKFLLLSSIVDKSRIWIELSEEEPHNQTASFEHALSTLRLADELVDLIRLDASENRSKLFWRETASEIYVNATKVCFKLNKPEEAFYFMEKNKALLLLEDLNRKQLLEESSIPEAIIEREAILSAEIAKHTTTDTYSASLSKAKDNYRRFIDSLDSDIRLYYKSQEPAHPIILESVQNTITSNQAYLEYILDDDQGYGLLITKDHIDFFEIDDCKTLKNKAKKFRALLSKPLISKSDQDQYFTVSNSIYKSLFPEHIKNRIGKKSLTIIPDYYLQNIPFEALLTNQKTDSFLIFNHNISYAYSLSLLNTIQSITSTNKNKLAGFAPINFETLPSLENTRLELELIGQLIPSDIYLDTNATKSSFLNNSNHHNIIHIASHANAGANDSISPWIAFHDKRLNLQELYRLNHQAELVVLSACETSLGETYKGEGVMSLARGFFNSGAHSVVSTLWKVNDKSSTQIMENFYKNLNNGENTSIALHKAKLNYIQSSKLSEKSPYYWASFVLIGDTKTLVHTDTTPYVYYIIFSLILLIIIILIFRRKKT
ncbi:CHAT domain-containing protein [Psychroserpens algicola]|uniref:CHAT domain-containing protein n=1 Tax=Psychroserpens algicola TaxID=1719034 RepID=A0ABT0H8A8_9FLAO|nr:CHAT domain-containing tetratricopeptide repeat protein [Psychroserpens algicola]MCK8480085.1 CHAT domain-containing protein [Psychroserpens algicola]